MAKQIFSVGQVLTAAQMTSLQQTAMGGGSTTAKTTSYVLVAADAGTVVQMNAAGATTITVNTALFAAGDSVQIQNIGAGVCTVTAGTATVTTAGSLALSQWEGGQLYFTATSSAIFFDIVQSSGMTNPMTTTGDTIYSSSGTTPARLGIGSASQVLTVSGGVPTWATPAAAGVTWAAYTPTFSEMTVGNATYTARSATSGKLVYFYIKFTLGSTTTFSTYPAFTLPTQPSYAQSFYGASKDYSAGIDYAMYFNNNGTDAICYIGGLRRPTTYVETQFAANVPMTWAVSDYFYVTGAYEIA